MNKDKLEFYFWKVFEFIIGLIGAKGIPTFAKIFSGLFFYVIPIRKDVVIKNLSKAFPQKSSKEINELARKNYYSTAVTFMELLLIPKMSEQEVINKFEPENLELALEKLNEKRGVLLLTGHLANWELGAIYLGIVMKSDLHVLVKKQRNALVADWMTSVREQFGNVEITLGVSVRELFKTLRSGGVIGIVSDQRGPKDGIKVNFFDQPTLSFPGFSALALKIQPTILVVTGSRKSNGKFSLEISEIPLNDLPADHDTAIKELNQRYMTYIENAIRKAPDQWLWMHNIWKYQ